MKCGLAVRQPYLASSLCVTPGRRALPCLWNSLANDDAATKIAARLYALWRLFMGRVLSAVTA